MPQCVEGTVVPSPMATTATPQPRGHECLLVVEDELQVREMVRDVLVRQGYRVHEAASGREALDVWRRFRADIDLVLTDIVTPDGIMGTDLVAKLRADRADLEGDLHERVQPGVRSRER